MENIIVPSSSNLGGNTKVPQVAPSKYWIFTLNNHTTQDIEMFRNIDSSIVPVIVFQEEVGEAGTPHLQGFLCFKTKKRPFNVFPDNKRIHWEKKKGSLLECYEYCTKEDTRKPEGVTYCRGFDKPFKIHIELNEWQRVLVKEMSLDADYRTVNWIWEPDGNVGKTLFQKWCFMNLNDCVVLGGKSADIKHGIIEYRNKNRRLPKIILINVPRTNLNYLNYCSIEEIKDMFFFSGKYEGGMVCGANPHIYIFANEPPKMENMSADRWKIRTVNSTRFMDCGENCKL